MKYGPGRGPRARPVGRSDTARNSNRPDRLKIQTMQVFWGLGRAGRPECTPILRIASEFRIVPHGDGGHYLVVALCDTVKLKDYMFHIFFLMKLSCVLFRPFKGDMPCISLFGCSELHMVLFMVSVASNRDIRFLYLPIWSYMNL